MNMNTIATDSGTFGGIEGRDDKKSNAVIEVQGVSHTFGLANDPRRVTALEQTSLTVTRGELVCLIGPSGCGKSTLLDIIGGLTVPTKGKVLVDGVPISGPQPRKIAYVFQDNTLFPWRTIAENVKLGMIFQGVPSEERAARTESAIAAVGLSEFANYYPAQLSGGMKQRAQLARALALGTDTLLMDEPFAALDEQTRMVLGEDLSILLARTSKTIVFVTHSLGEAAFLADRVAVFSARPGRVKEIVRVDEGHPRPRGFMTSTKLAGLRNDLYELLHEEIRETLRGEMRARADGAP
jgi:ABC-type nitrate/sulfonate/bicarbonate transport system ATPase subunit